MNQKDIKELITTMLSGPAEKIKTLEEKVESLESDLESMQHNIDHPFGCQCASGCA